MNLAISDQLLEFLLAAVLGVGLGVLYDILAIIRSYIKASKGINFVFDTLFWLFAIFALFAFVMFFTKGNMRGYILFGNFFGIFLYKNTISPLFFRASRIIIESAVKFLNYLSSPLRKIGSKGSEKNGFKGKEKEKTQG